MAQKEFINLIEENIFISHRLAERLKVCGDGLFGYTKAQISALLRLYLGGRAMLKDIARREYTTAPNLCVMFRALESDGLVLREPDDNDRRNMWYSVTESGAKLVEKILAEFRSGIATMFKNISDRDEKKLTVAMITINEILTKMEMENA